MLRWRHARILGDFLVSNCIIDILITLCQAVRCPRDRPKDTPWQLQQHGHVVLPSASQRQNAEDANKSNNSQYSCATTCRDQSNRSWGQCSLTCWRLSSRVSLGSIWRSASKTNELQIVWDLGCSIIRALARCPFRKPSACSVMQTQVQ